MMASVKPSASGNRLAMWNSGKARPGVHAPMSAKARYSSASTRLARATASSAAPTPYPVAAAATVARRPTTPTAAALMGGMTNANRDATVNRLLMATACSSHGLAAAGSHPPPNTPSADSMDAMLAHPNTVPLTDASMVRKAIRNTARCTRTRPPHPPIA